MPRYITVEGALNTMCDNCDSVQAVCPHYPCKRYTAVESIHPADVVEVRRGKWEVLDILDYAQRRTGRKVGKCRFCGYLTGEFSKMCECHHQLTNFCPDCGTAMERSEE